MLVSSPTVTFVDGRPSGGVKAMEIGKLDNLTCYEHGNWQAGRVEWHGAPTDYQIAGAEKAEFGLCGRWLLAGLFGYKTSPWPVHPDLLR